VQHDKITYFIGWKNHKAKRKRKRWNRSVEIYC